MHLEARMDLLRELADMGLGFIREGRRCLITQLDFVRWSFIGPH